MAETTPKASLSILALAGVEPYQENCSFQKNPASVV